MLIKNAYATDVFKNRANVVTRMAATLSSIFCAIETSFLALLLQKRVLNMAVISITNFFNYLLKVVPSTRLVT